MKEGAEEALAGLLRYLEWRSTKPLPDGWMNYSATLKVQSDGTLWVSDESLARRADRLED